MDPTKIKTRYYVQSKIIQCIKTGLTQMGLQPEQGSTEKPWGVQEFAQASFNNADKIALVDYVRSYRVGFQGWDHKRVGGNVVRIDDWLEEQSWLIHTLRRIKPEDVSSSLMTCEDMASLLIGWFNGTGATELRKSGIGTLRIDRSQIFVYNDESEIYQKRAAFPLRIQVPKEISTQAQELSGWTSGIYPV